MPDTENCSTAHSLCWAKDHEQICHFRRLENVKILQLTYFTEPDLTRRQWLPALFFGWFVALNHSGNTHAIFLFASCDESALVQLYWLKIFAVLNRPVKAKQAVLLWALPRFPQGLSKHSLLKSHCLWHLTIPGSFHWLPLKSHPKLSLQISEGEPPHKSPVNCNCIVPLEKSSKSAQS